MIFGLFRALSSMKLISNVWKLARGTAYTATASTGLGVGYGLSKQGTKSFKQLAILFIVLTVLSNRK